MPRDCVPSPPSDLAAWFEAAGLALPAGAPAGLEPVGFTDDSRAIVPGGVFIAVAGESVDGHRFIPQALEAGAALVLANERSRSGVDRDLERQGRMLCLPDTRAALGPLAQAWHGNPARAMLTAGVTGTNGKTTVVYLLESLLREAGRRPAVFGTVSYRYGGGMQPAPTTTPGALALAAAMARAREMGDDAAAMEVSSHALQQHRADGLDFDLAIMTNLTQDHLDYHHTMEEYAEAKRLLFSRLAPRQAVFNFDDPTARRFHAEHGGDKLSFSLDPEAGADVACLRLETGPEGLRLLLRLGVGGEELELRSSLRGRFNASNLLAAVAGAHTLGFAPEAIARGIERAPAAPGRFEAVEAGQDFQVFVDYAHTPDAVERILENVREITPGRVIAVLGCGGDRDPGKRPRMGAALARLADFSIVTSDNPRYEEPLSICRAVEMGLRTERADAEYEVRPERREAIRLALESARAGDSVLIAGKGHEDYQEIQGRRIHFDDRETAREILGTLQQGHEGGIFPGREAKEPHE